MYKIRLGLWLLSAVALSSHADINPNQFLMDQVLWGEIYYRDDFVKHSLERLKLIAPNSPEVLAAEIRLAIREKKYPLAEKLLKDLKQKAPGSTEYNQAKKSLYLTQPVVQQKLEQARIMAMSGRISAAIAEYDALFHGDFPTLELNAEYWTLVARIPRQEENALNHLQMLYHFLVDHHIYPNNSNKTNWTDGLRITISRLLVTKGNDALKRNHINMAQNNFQEALKVDKNNYKAWIGIGDVAFASKDYSNAEVSYKHAYTIDHDLPNAVYGLLSIYKRQSLQSALNYLNSLPDDQKIKFQNARNQIKSALLQEQAVHLEHANQWTQAIAKYTEAEKIDSDNVWLIYHLSYALKHQGQTAKANMLFQEFIAKHKNNPEQTYAYALYLSNSEHRQKALSQLRTIPEKQWNDKMRQLSQRLTTELILQHAKQMYLSGQKLAAVNYLKQQTPTTDVMLTLADWSLNDKQYVSALKYYQRVLSQDPKNADANLGAIETLIILGDKKKALHLLEQLSTKKMTFSLNMNRRIANAWNDVGNAQRALVIFNTLKKQRISATPNQDNALLFRDAAQLETQLNLPKIAQEDYKKSMVLSKITPTWPTNNDIYTFLTRNHEEDDWLKRSIRSGAALLYQKQETRVTVTEDYWQLAGTPGISELSADDTITQADWGLYGGRAYVRADTVNLSAGSFSTVNGLYFSNFGTCNLNGCSANIVQKTHGISWDGGWQNNLWGMDIGQTPVGFPVVNWIGGVNYSGSIQNIGWTLTASQRPMTNSLLSFAGTADPNTGIIWGGVVARGLTLSLSYDRGGANGFWANIIGSQLTGKNVENNKRILLMDGVYHKIINKDDRRLSIGLTNMLWHYEKNLDGYTLGQGGYYSPDFYLSFTVPVAYRQRTSNWSYELGGSLTWSRATTANLVTYPLPNLYPNLNSLQNNFQMGGTSTGHGYSVIALIERRLSSHFILGGLANLQHSTDYTPSHLSLYLRYSLEGWEGDMNGSIIPLIPYSNFR